MRQRGESKSFQHTLCYAQPDYIIVKSYSDPTYRNSIDQSGFLYCTKEKHLVVHNWSRKKKEKDFRCSFKKTVKKRKIKSDPICLATTDFFLQ